MKRLINSSKSIASDYSARGRRQYMKYIIHDIHALESAQSIDELKQVELYTFNPKLFIKHVEEDIQNGVDFETSVEQWIDSYYKILDRAREDYAKALKAEEDRPLVEAYINENIKDMYELISEDISEDTGYTTYIFKAPEGATHQDCINFVDDFRKAIGARYNGTGYGGSWTSWDLATPNGLKLKAGWTRNDNFYIEVRNMV